MAIWNPILILYMYTYVRIFTYIQVAKVCVYVCTYMSLTVHVEMDCITLLYTVRMAPFHEVV